MDERENPGLAFARPRLEAVGRAPDLEKGVLHGVLGERGIAQHTERQAVRDAAEPVVELAERGLVRLRDGFQQRLVGELRHIPSHALTPLRSRHRGGD